MEDIKTTFQKLADSVSPSVKEKYTLNEAYKDLVESIKCIPNVLQQYEEGLQKQAELCKLINAIADLSSNKMARVLDDIIKEMAYSLAESNYETRKIYLSEAVKDLASGMDETDVLLKYEDILYRAKGWL